MSQQNDLVIRDGFPALRNKDGTPNISDPEALPVWPFWGCQQAFDFGASLDDLRHDCECVFSARTRDDHASYSAGVTYFLPCTMAPRCALEELVQSIFEKHVSKMDASWYRAELSGAEWWTLVLDDDEEKEGSAAPAGDNNNDNEKEEDDGEEEEEGDEVGLHYDADYGLEAQAPGLLLHPRLATVTYLSDFGAPTVVFDCPSPAPGKMVDTLHNRAISKGWLSHPEIGKHIAFDGRLLHGAPATFFPPLASKKTAATNKRSKVDPKRITLLVNIWLNHCPVDAEPLGEDTIVSLKLKGDSKMTKCCPGKDFDLDKLPELERKDLNASKDDPAGEEEVIICNHLVTVKYQPSMDDLHDTPDSFTELHFKNSLKIVKNSRLFHGQEP